MGMTAGETHILISMEIRCLKAFFSLYYGCPWDNTKPMLVHFQPKHG